MQTMTILIGLPGSGKTTYIKKNKEHFKNAVILDEFQKDALENSIMIGDSLKYQGLIQALKEGKDIVLADIAWCTKERQELLEKELRELLEELGIQVRIKFIYFENNARAAKQNIMKRDRSGKVDLELELLDNLSKNYFIPEEGTTVPVATN